MRYQSRIFANSTVAYAPLLKDLLTKGDDVGSRLGATKELSMVNNLAYPRQMVPLVGQRRFNYFGMLAEAFWVLSDVDELALIGTWNSGLKQYSDDGEHMYGAYGPRLYTALENSFARWHQDIETRQVVLPIFTPDDVSVYTKDLPCNTSVMLKARDGHLHMAVTNRSNDLHLGLLGVNMPQFAMLQNYVANRLQLQLGYQSHVSDSLHLYLEQSPQKEITARMVKTGIPRNTYHAFIHSDLWYWDKPVVLFGDQWTHTYERRTIRDWFEYLHRNVSDKPDVVGWGKESFTCIAAALLSHYVRVKEKSVQNRWTDLHDRLLDWSAVCDEADNIPMDWVLACISTTIHQTAPHDKDALDKGIRLFTTLLLEWGIECNEDWCVEFLESVVD